MSERLAEIQARSDAASPGPWMVDSEDPSGFDLLHAHMPEIGYPIAQFIWLDRGRERMRANAEFCAAARTDIPFLLELLEQRDAENTRLRKALDAGKDGEE